MTSLSSLLMPQKHRKSLFIFRRDLRLEDNTGLIAALNSSLTVISAFIFTPEQLKDNPYKSNRCLQFMLESLVDLDQKLQKKKSSLHLFEGSPTTIVERCIEELKIDAVFVNRDYTPYSISRDASLKALCDQKKIPFFSFDDALLNPPEACLKKDHTPYVVFTPYFRHVVKIPVDPPKVNHHLNYFEGSIPFSLPPSYLTKMIEKLKLGNPMKGGRIELKGITHLSPYLKFTTYSPREIFFSTQDPLLKRALYWRDFFTSIAFHFPHVFHGAFHKKFDQLSWSNDEEIFRRWCEGKTGFPIVDAGMRQLNQTGFISNRMRMITASFLIKDLHIDWRWGERYFAKNLIDYDPAVNNGNWQWVASTGCDAVPYFRIFNPWTQQKRFDPDCSYIKQWITEIRDLSPKLIHNWYKETVDLEYPRPLLDHSIEAKKTLHIYKSLK